MIENPQTLTEQLLNFVERIATEMKAILATVQTKQDAGDYATRTELAQKADSGHKHAIADVTNLQDTLDAKALKSELTSGLASKANASHTHAISSVSGLQTALDGKQPTGNYVTRDSADSLYLGINSKAVSASKADSASTAAKLTTARTISASGDASWSVSFDGSGNVSAKLSLASSGAKAGSYGPSAAATLGFGGTVNVPYVTVDAKGRVTSIAHYAIKLPAAPTTVSGNAGSATKLATARTFRVNLASTSAVSFNGTANVTPGVTGILPVARGGTGRSDGHAPLDVLQSDLTDALTDLILEFGGVVPSN